MSNPDASAGPYAANEKKPVGGNILAHASTTRSVPSHYRIFPRPTFVYAVGYNSRKEGRIPVKQRFTTLHVFPNQKQCLPFWRLVLATQRKSHKHYPSRSQFIIPSLCISACVIRQTIRDAINVYKQHVEAASDVRNELIVTGMPVEWVYK